MKTRRRLVAISLAGSMLAAVLAITNAPVAAADDPPIDHPSLVPTEPIRGYPRILTTPTFIVFSGNCPNGCVRKRQSYAVNLSGKYLVSGGDFQSIQLQNGSVVSQPHLAVFDTETKQLACATIHVDNEVLAIEPGPDPESVIIAGRFKKVTGADGVQRTRNRIAKIDLGTCSVDTSWDGGPINSRVDQMAVSGDRLFIGGSFTSVQNQSISKLAELDLNTGQLRPSFSFSFGGAYAPIKGLGASPDGDRLGVVHSATSINGASRRATAVFNISNPQSPVLTNHSASTGSKAWTNYYDIQDGALTPDFSAFVIAQGTATISDYVSKIPTNESPGQFAWQHYMRDSIFGIDASNNAVYVGGHFCKVDTGPGPTSIMSPNSGPDECTGSRFGGGAWRTQLAALSLTDGTPLTWNPGNNAGRGASAIKVVPRGLLVGFDGNRTNFFNTGTTAFFDFGFPLPPPPPPPPPPPEDQTCTATAGGQGVVELTWTEIDGENSYNVRRGNSWVANVNNGLSYTVTNSPVGAEYSIRSKLAGVTTNTDCVFDGPPPPPPPGQTCSLTDNGNGTVSLTWTEIDGEDKYAVRRNSSWVGNYFALSATVSGSGADDWQIRSRKSGVTTDTTCE